MPALLPQQLYPLPLHALATHASVSHATNVLARKSPVRIPTVKRGANYRKNASTEMANFRTRKSNDVLSANIAKGGENRSNSHTPPAVVHRALRSDSPPVMQMAPAAPSADMVPTAPHRRIAWRVRLRCVQRRGSNAIDNVDAHAAFGTPAPF